MRNRKLFDGPNILLLWIIAFFLSVFSTVNVKSANVVDSENFKVKGFHLDLRIQVMTIDALKDFANEMADFGFNTLVMEWEASYPYKEHVTISNEYSYSRKEVESFIKHCRSLGIEVIPLQQCFGHVEYILRNNRYNHLKEDRKDISQICPLKVVEDSLLFRSLFEDMASIHHSNYIHIGGDETYLLGHCPDCSAKVKREGKSKLFVDYMKMICEIVVDLGKRPIMWADIILKYPEAVDALPDETVFVDWNYGWDINHFGDIDKLQDKGFTFWGAPAIRSHPDNWYVTYWEKHLNNQRDFIPYARNADYEGLIMTSWSTSGLYGFIWDVGYEVVEMEQIRNTYPLSGFRILVAAYSQAVNQKKPIVPHEFVQNYAAERFGLSKEEAKEFCGALLVKPELIVNGEPASGKQFQELLDENDKSRIILNKLEPNRNLKEFDHFRMMFDLRDYYLSFKKIESIYNSKDFDISDSDELIPMLKQLLERGKILDSRFFSLNKGFLYDSEIEEQNKVRNRPVRILYNRLSKRK